MTGPQASAVTIVAHDVGGIGGMERQLERLIRGLAEDGIEVRVVSRTMNFQAPGVHWFRVPGPSRPFAFALPWFFVAGSLVTRARARGLLHATGAIVAGKVDVSTVHYCHAAAPRELRQARASRSTVAYRVNAVISDALARLGERWCYRPSRVRTLIGVSPRVSEEVRHFFPGTHVETIPNGVDPATFSPDPSERLRRRAELGIGESELVALFVGGDWERKGLSAAVDALAFAPRWRLLVVGDGDQASAAARARRTGVGDRLHFFRPTPAVDGFYKLADAFVLPTRYETFSLVTYEAAACGLPLLATLVGGIEDILRDGETGFAIDGDPRAIGARLEQLASSPTLREALGNAAHARARDYSWDRIVARYRVLYDRLSAA